MEVLIKTRNTTEKTPKNSCIDEINTRIQREICQKTITDISDMSMMKQYKECKSVNKSIDTLLKILQNYTIDETTQKNIIDDYTTHLIPSGTKGVMRGNKFNKIIKDFINDFNLDDTQFDIKFEKKHEKYATSEIPDWFIYDKSNEKILIGMNQLDLWNGGHQKNRGSKYIIEQKNTDGCKLICVICNDVKIKTEKSKVFNLFDIGFKNNTLCYKNNLKIIIFDYFEIKLD